MSQTESAAVKCKVIAIYFFSFIHVSRHETHHCIENLTRNMKIKKKKKSEIVDNNTHTPTTGSHSLASEHSRVYFILDFFFSFYLNVHII